MRGVILLALLLATPALAGPDRETRAWWDLANALSGDAMEGRDTGSPGHARAVALVAARFKAAGLKPAGDAGGFTQSVPLHEIKVEAAGTSMAIIGADGSVTNLRFLHDMTPRAAPGLPARLEAGMVFAGYCGAGEMTPDVRGRIAVCFANRRAGLPSATDRLAAVTAAGAVAMIAVDDPEFNLEPARWPDAYARSVGFADAPAVASIPVLRLNAASFAPLIAGSGHLAAALLTDGSARRPLPGFALPARFRATFATSERDYSSDNVLALLPGTDPKLAPEVLVVSAHIDGYGRGEPVAGDDIYNGTLDDAAYVGTLVRLAEARHGKGFARSVLFAAFTGEEKGLLGARWFVAHPTVPKAALVADINLDQIRPLFPLRSLTMHGINDSTLGATARAVADTMRIDIRPDREPERNLNQRADHWPFRLAGIPATGFIFGYDSHTDAEVLARGWAVTRYHKPQDDPAQPIDWKAARDFNNFFYALTAAVADAPVAPALLPGVK